MVFAPLQERWRAPAAPGARSYQHSSMARRGLEGTPAIFLAFRDMRGTRGREDRMSRLRLRTMILLAAMVSGFHARNAVAAAESPAHPAVATTTGLEHATQALVDALAPGRTAVWEHYSDPGLTYVTEDNEVKSRKELLAEMKSLPPGSSGWI